MPQFTPSPPKWLGPAEVSEESTIGGGKGGGGDETLKRKLEIP